MSRSSFLFSRINHSEDEEKRIFCAALISHSRRGNYDLGVIILCLRFLFFIAKISPVHPLSLFFLANLPIVLPLLFSLYLTTRSILSILSTLFLARSLILIFIPSFRVYRFLGKMRISHHRRRLLIFSHIFLFL